MNEPIVDDVVIPAQEAISVYANNRGGIVLCAQTYPEHSYVIFDADHADRIIDAIKRVKREIIGDRTVEQLGYCSEKINVKITKAD